LVSKLLTLGACTLVQPCGAVFAQSCDLSRFGLVKEWVGSFTLTGNGSGTIPGDDVVIATDYSVHETVTGSPDLVYTSEIGAFGKTNASITFNVTFVTHWRDGTSTTLVAAGKTFSVSGNAFEGFHLSLDPSTCQYSFFADPTFSGTVTQEDVTPDGVDTTTSNADDLEWGPAAGPDGNPAYGILPVRNVPIPSQGMVLAGTLPAFSASALYPPPEPIMNYPVNWVVNWKLNPKPAKKENDNQDDPCDQNVASSIACQNQSLREDVPIVGSGLFLHYESSRLPGTSGAIAVATTDALSIGGWTLNVHHAYDPASDTLFLGDGQQRSAWQLAGSSMLNGNYLVTSQDGSEIYIFDGTSLLHTQTLKPMTGAIKYQFGYDAAGRLTSVTDGSGNVTTIQRDASENPTAIVSPFSQSTNLAVDSNGFLSQVIDPVGHALTFVHDAGGLLTSRIDANGNTYNYTYDSLGKLINDADSAGGSTTLSRADSDTGYSVTTTTALGRTHVFHVTTGLAGEQFLNTWPSGLQATMSTLQQNGQLVETSALPDGTAVSSTKNPDPRWGLQTPLASSTTLTFGSLTANSSVNRTVIPGADGNPFSLNSQTDTESINGRTYTSVFTGATQAYVDTTPMGRKTTRTLDPQERLSSLQIGALLPINFGYDGHGRLSTITQGTRVQNMAYDSNGFLSSISDPLNLTTQFTRALDGRLLSTTLPDGRVVSYSYDANGNVTSITPPGKSAHGFSYSAVDLVSTYTPPTVPGTDATTYDFDADPEMTAITRPDGQMINFEYDSAGRLSSTVTPTEAINYTYDATTGHLSSAAIVGGETVKYGYNGPLPTSTTWTGIVAGGTSRTYNNNFWLLRRTSTAAPRLTFYMTMMVSSLRLGRWC
jgi:YD repeat-containing protein